MRTRIIVFMAAAVLFAQTDGSLPAQLQNHSSFSDARQIIEPSIAATERNWQARDWYTYVECDESRRLDADGRVKSQDVDISRIISVNGAPFEQLVEHNGRLLSAEEQMKHEVKGKLKEKAGQITNKPD